jgi:putative MATE family efflux protein
MLKSNLRYSEILSVASPIMVGVFVQFAVIITDSAFLNRVGTLEFNASGNAGMLYVTLYMLAMGISSGAQIIIARRDGEKNFGVAGELFRQTNFVLILNALLFVALVLISSFFLLPYIVSDIPTMEYMQDFLLVRSWGYLFSLPVLAYQAFYSGIARTRIIMYYTMITAGVNVVLDYCMIFGKFGFPQMGLEGAALATVLSEVAALAFVFFYARADRSIIDYKIQRRFSPDKKMIREILNLSWPLMLQGVLSTGTWTVFFFFIEHLGPRNLEISQSIRMFYLIALIPVMGLGVATRTFVSHLISENRTDEVPGSVLKIIFINVIATLLLTLPNLFFPEWVVPVITQNPDILSDTAFTLQVVTGAMFLLAITQPMLNMIAGAGDSKASFRIEASSIFIYFFGAWYFTMYHPQPIHIVWCMEYVYFGFTFIFSLMVIRTGKWKHIQV